MKRFVKNTYPGLWSLIQGLRTILSWLTANQTRWILKGSLLGLGLFAVGSFVALAWAIGSPEFQQTRIDLALYRFTQNVLFWLALPPCIALGMTIVRFWPGLAAFLFHQLMGTEGVVWLTFLSVFLAMQSIRQMHEQWADSALMGGLRLISSNTPFFPIQIALGIHFGWKLYRRWGHRSMFWIWILPSAALTYVVITNATFSPWTVPVDADTGPLAHYFGWGCQAVNRCYDQLTFTQRFYTSAAYSLGAILAAWKQKTALQQPVSVQNKGA